MADIKNNLLNVRENIPKDVLLVAVTKTHTLGLLPFWI